MLHDRHTIFPYNPVLEDRNPENQHEKNRIKKRIQRLMMNDSFRHDRSTCQRLNLSENRIKCCIIRSIPVFSACYIGDTLHHRLIEIRGQDISSIIVEIFFFSRVIRGIEKRSRYTSDTDDVDADTTLSEMFRRNNRIDPDICTTIRQCDDHVTS